MFDVIVWWSGFTEIKSACCGLGNLNADVPCLPIAKFCSNRNNHLFWDLYHPTQEAHRMFANYIFDGPFTYPLNLNQLIALWTQMPSHTYNRFWSVGSAFQSLFNHSNRERKLRECDLETIIHVLSYFLCIVLLRRTIESRGCIIYC